MEWTASSCLYADDQTTLKSDLNQNVAGGLECSSLDVWWGWKVVEKAMRPPKSQSTMNSHKHVKYQIS